MLNSELKDLCNKVSIKYFNKSLPDDVIISVNNRLSRAYGQEYLDYRTYNYHIDISGKFLNDDYPRAIIIDCIKHELCHLYLEPRHLKRAHGKVFKNLLKHVRGIYTIPVFLANYNPKAFIYVYQCQKCGKIVYFTYSNANKQWRCKCHGQFKPLGYVHKDVFLKLFLHDQYNNPEPKMPQNIEPLVSKKIQLSLF